VILATTALALVGFSLYPVMPPRLLDSTSHYGGADIAQARGIEPIGIHDTLADVGGLWSFDSGAMTKLSNQYAAMPSLHCAWATWCALVGWRLTRRRWLRATLVIYPFLTLFCIIVTGNHFWIDGIGGLATLGIGFLLGHYFDEWNDWRLERNLGPDETDPGATDASEIATFPPA
jgi:membrane-associated phospholipid phosphatase